MHGLGDLEKEFIPKSLQVYTRCFKDVVSTTLLVDPESIVAYPDPPHYASLPTDHLLPTVEMDTSTSSDLDVPIARQKGK